MLVLRGTVRARLAPRRRAGPLLAGAGRRLGLPTGGVGGAGGGGRATRARVAGGRRHAVRLGVLAQDARLVATTTLSLRPQDPGIT